MIDPKHAVLPALTAALLALGACGDAETTDDRQWYSKAPLEDPGMTIDPEIPSEMAELGEPDLLGTGAPDAETERTRQAPADDAEADATSAPPAADSATG